MAFDRKHIYILIVVIIILLLILKCNLIEKETFTDNYFLLQAQSGPNVILKSNNIDLLANIPSTKKKENAIYLAIIKVNGIPRMIESYSANDSVKLIEDLKIYFDRSRLIDDKYLVLFTKGSAGAQFSIDLKNYIKNTFKSSKVNDVSNAKPYLLVYDLIDENIRAEEIGDNGTTVSFNNTLFSTKRELQLNQDGLIITGLQCYLDSTKKESYSPEFNTTWKDLSGNNRHFNWQTTPQFADGKMLNTFKYGKIATGPNGNTFGIDDGSKGYAIILYSKTNTLRNSNAFLFEGVSDYYGIASSLTWGNSWVYFDQGWPNKGIGKNRVEISIPDWNEYHVWAFVRAYDGSLKVYKDGNLIISGVANGATSLNLKPIPVKLARDWDANMSKFLVYNIHLMPEDVKQISDWILSDEKKQREARIKSQETKLTTTLPVKLGLQLHLDSRQYVQGSLDWKDISGNGYDFKWNTAPQIENGSILLNRGEYAISNKGSRLLNIDGRDSYTICWTAKTNQLSQNSVFKIMGNHLWDRAIFVHPTWLHNRIEFDQAGCCDESKNRVSCDISKFSSEYAFYCIRKTDKERAIYVNGVKLCSKNTSGDSINVNDEPMIIGRDLQNNYTWYANIKNFIVYNRDLSDSEITKLYNKVFSKYEIATMSYDDSEQFCRKRGMRLCKTDEYCPSNKPIYTLDENLWGPIAEYPNGWVQLGPGGESCKTYKQKCSTTKDATCNNNGDPIWGEKREKEIALLCCDTKYQPLLINAILDIKKGDETKTYYFKDKFYQVANYVKNVLTDVSKVQSINTFKGLTKNFANGNIDGISITNKEEESIWFAGKYVMIYNSSTQIGREMLLSEYFNKLPDDFKSGSIDAIACRGAGSSYILFKKTRYCVVDMTANTKSKEGFINTLAGLPQDFTLGFFDCASYSGRVNCSYIFKNDKVIEYNFSNNSVVKGPFSVSNLYGFLLPPFSAKNQICSTYERLSKLPANTKYWLDKYYKTCKGVVKKEYDTNLDTYKALVDKYNVELNKTKGESKRIKEQIDAFAKALEAKRLQMLQLEGKLLDLKAKPCKRDEVCKTNKVRREICNNEIPDKVDMNKINKKRIIVKEKEVQDMNPKFYELDSRKVENCYYDPNVGKEYEGGFNFFKHPKYKEFVDASLVRNITDFDIRDHPDYSNYIPKSKIPKQRTSKDFNIREHPDYIKYEIKKETKVVPKLLN